MILRTVFLGSKYLILTIVVLLAGSCKRGQTNAPTGPTTREVIERNRQPYAELRQRLGQIAQLLPPKGSVKNNISTAKSVTRLNLNPPPIYNRSLSSPINDNMGVLSAEQLLDPDTKPEFDLNLMGFPQNCFYWLSEKFTSTADMNAVDSGRLAPGFEAGLARPYLLVYRTTRYDRPQVINSTSFTPGAIDLEVFVVDMPAKKILTSFLASAQTSQEAKYPADSNIEVHVVDTMRQNVRAVIADALTKTTGGSLNYR